jgi:hypothetical protein
MSNIGRLTVPRVGVVVDDEPARPVADRHGRELALPGDAAKICIFGSPGPQPMAASVASISAAPWPDYAPPCTPQ